MFKLLISIFCFLSLSHLEAKVTARWFSVSCIVIEDGQTQILFDPMFTRASWQHWLNLSELRSDETLVVKTLKEHQLEKIKAVFASHSHFDHVIDAPMVSKHTGATFYVDKSSQRVAQAYKEPKIITSPIENLKKIQVGQFTITPIQRKHSAIKGIFEFLPGEVPEDFNFSFYDYHVGDTWFYLIEHPEGKILLDQGSEPYLEKLKAFTSEVQVIIQGIANRKSDDTIIKGYSASLKPRIFIPTHFDNFFFSFDPQSEVSFLPEIRLEELQKAYSQAHPGTKFVFPKFGEQIVLLE